MKCPYCAEEIKDEAVVCRYCGKDLSKASMDERLEKIANFWGKKEYERVYEVEYKDGKLEVWRRAQEMSVGVLILLLFLGIVPAIIYAIVKANPQAKKLYTFEIRDDRVYKNGYPMNAKELKRQYGIT